MEFIFISVYLRLLVVNHYNEYHCVNTKRSPVARCIICPSMTRPARKETRRKPRSSIEPESGGFRPPLAWIFVGLVSKPPEDKQESASRRKTLARSLICPSLTLPARKK